MEVGLRVLAAINDHREPNPVDTAKLRCLAPDLKDLPLEEVACQVVRQGVEKRQAQREELPRKKHSATQNKIA